MSKHIVYVNGKRKRTCRSYIEAVKTAFRLEAQGYEKVRVNEP